MKTIKAKVIMLPTNDKPTKGSVLLRHLWKDTKLECRSIWQYDETKQLSDTVAVYTTLNGSFMDTPSSFKPQHVYLTIDEEIKEGDWCINLAHNVLVKPTDLEWANSNKDNLKKVVATTDTSLWEHDDTVPYTKTRPALPQIPQEFLKKYCEAGGINEIEIECNTTCAGDLCSSTYKRSIQCISPVNCKFQKIKFDSNNCIIIYEIKNNFTRVELDNILSKFAETFVANADTAYKQKDIDEWKLKNI